jgi:hypothetical protein
MLGWMSTAGPPKPPPPPVRKPAPQIPTKPKEVNEEQIDELAEMAMVLREEQVQARIIHYKGEMETNAELDAITAQVVEQLKALQTKVASEKSSSSTLENVEQDQQRSMRKLVGRLFRPEAPSVLVQRELKEISRRFSRLFFEAELHERLVGSETEARLKTIQHAEQGLYYVLRRYEHRLRAELEGFNYVDEEIKERTFEMLANFTNDMRVSFLSRRSPELKRLVALLQESLLDFFCNGLPPRLDRLATEVIIESGSAHVQNAVGYKIMTESFPRFRVAFERRFLTWLVMHVQGQLVEKLRATGEHFGDDAIAFVQAPHIYTDICSLICDSVYDFLCNEGFLDLPIDWRSANSEEGTSLTFRDTPTLSFRTSLFPVPL